MSVWGVGIEWGLFIVYSVKDIYTSFFIILGWWGSQLWGFKKKSPETSTGGKQIEEDGIGD